MGFGGCFNGQLSEAADFWHFTAFVLIFDMPGVKFASIAISAAP